MSCIPNFGGPQKAYFNKNFIEIVGAVLKKIKLNFGRGEFQAKYGIEPPPQLSHSLDVTFASQYKG